MADLAALVPPVGVALLFWFVMRAVLGADRRERAAMAELDRREAEREAAAAARAAGDAREAAREGVVVGEVVREAAAERTAPAGEGTGGADRALGRG